ncbi:putative transcription factor interactor and regulator CCHC(Zn) family [Helianthus annuus]|nr:putative transcription factor interactor and regulator CCHC(Zn) family [Helianthus annuus]
MTQDTYEALHIPGRVEGKNRNWRDEHHLYIDSWSSRHQNVVAQPASDSIIASEQYMRWYSSHGLLFIGNPRNEVPQGQGFPNDGGRVQMLKFKIKELKELCWDIGSTTQQRKYDHSVDLMKGIKPEAWEYLEEIGEDRWTLVHDRNNRRWGTLTTNISESFNHALKGIRMMPIKAIIERTFDKTVEHFLMNNQVAHNCRTRLAPYRYEWYQIRYQNSRHHRLQEYSYVSGRYRVISKIQTNECGGNDYTVEYYKETCTCGKWQMQRFPCSHAIAVSQNRGDSPHNTINKIYYNAAYKAQYAGEFFPLDDPKTWVEPAWKIKPNTSRITTKRGRRKSRRIHSEMDWPEHTTKYRCGICHQRGHKRNACTSHHQ